MWVWCSGCDCAFTLYGWQLRLLSLIAEMNDYGVGYLGSSRSEREARATVEHQTVSNNYIGSSAGVGLDVHAHAHVHAHVHVHGHAGVRAFRSQTSWIPEPPGEQNSR